MKKIISLLLIVVCLFSFSACSGKVPDETYEYQEIHEAPENCIEMAPWNFYLEWDIPSVRDGYADWKSYDDEYSMPVYRFDTYEELAHLKEIVGREYIGKEIPGDEWTSYGPKYIQYDEEFFEKYSLLIGWCNYPHVEILDTSTYVPSYFYDSRENKLTVEITDVRDSSGTPQPYWILVAVEKEYLENCESIAFFLKTSRY